jgi:hypothetical protein
LKNLVTKCVLMLSLGGGVAFGQAAPTREAPRAPIDLHDLTGYWELSSRSVPTAQLAPTVTKAKLQQVDDADHISERWCRPLGLPAEMAVPRPLTIAQGHDEVAILFESNAALRHLYFRDKHTNPEILDPTSTGESIAHWDGDTLVVETIGFHEKNGRLRIPGGGFRTEKSHLEERFQLIKNGQILSVTSTWTDPSVFAKPQTYEYRYARINGMYEPRQPMGCNPYDKEQAEFIERTFSPELKKAAEDAGAEQVRLGEGYRQAGQQAAPRSQQ